jgi:hypothetical protein
MPQTEQHSLGRQDNKYDVGRVSARKQGFHVRRGR